MYAFIEAIKIEGIPWNLEYFNDSKKTALCFKRNADAVIKESYIGGGYKAEFNFSILIQLSNRDKKHMLDVSRILYMINEVFQKEQEAEFPHLQIDGARPLNLEMTTLPADYEGEGIKLSTFMAGFCLTYEKKGRFE